MSLTKPPVLVAPPVARGRSSDEPRAGELIEEAIQLLRRAPAGTLAWYYAGAVPWVLAVLFFWGYTTWFYPPPETIAWGALGLVGLFGVLKTAQAAFCAQLLAQRLAGPVPAWGWRGWVRVAAGQLRLQAWGLYMLPVAMVLSVPCGWVYAYLQTATVLGAETRAPGAAGLRSEAWALAQRWPGQNHLALLYLALLALVGAINLGLAFFLGPWLANRVLGIDNLWGVGGWSVVNSTFLASVVMLTWLAVDPLVKAYYVLRVYHGRVRRTGADLLEVFARSAARRRTGALLVLLLTLGVVGPVWPATAPAAPAGQPVTASPRVDPARLDREIERVLAQRDFRWRLRPERPKLTEESAGPVARFFRAGFQIVREVLRTLQRVWTRVTNWLDGLFPRPVVDGKTSSGRGGAAWAWVRLGLYVGLALVLGLIVWVAVRIWRQARRERPRRLVAAPAGVVVPDLRDEQVQAAQLPADGWQALAREKMAAGEWRLALRALYLATLAGLAGEGLVTLAKFKTNLDYERELRRRALAREALIAQFSIRRRLFEAVWYGCVPAEENAVRAWLSELEEAPRA